MTGFSSLTRPIGLNMDSGAHDDQKSQELIPHALVEDFDLDKCLVDAPMAQEGNNEALSPRMYPSTPAGSGCGARMNLLDYEDKPNYYQTELKPSSPLQSPMLQDN